MSHGGKAESVWVQRILRTQEYIRTHLADDLSAEDLARVAGFSLHHFHRVFRGISGESVMEYTRRLRLEQAAMRLKYSEEPVVDVALRSGYQSHEGFTRAFSAQFGAAPSVYREAAQRQTPADWACSVAREVEWQLAGVRYQGPYEGCAVAWQQLFALVGQHGIPVRTDQGTVGLCYDDPEVTEAAHCRYEACVPLAAPMERAELPEGMLLRTLPAGSYARVLHQGPYAAILPAYVALLGEWLPRRGVELPDEPVVEVYLNSPMDTPPEALRTEVRVRVLE